MKCWRQHGQSFGRLSNNALSGETSAAVLELPDSRSVGGSEFDSAAGPLGLVEVLFAFESLACLLPFARDRLRILSCLILCLVIKLINHWTIHSSWKTCPQVGFEDQQMRSPGSYAQRHMAHKEETFLLPMLYCIGCPGKGTVTTERTIPASGLGSPISISFSSYTHVSSVFVQ